MAKKKALLGVVCLAMVALIAVFGTVAYLTDRDAETNVFTSGDVAIELTEGFEQGAELMPGVDITKKPIIENTGKNDAWVWIEFAIPSALDNWNPNGDNGSYNNVIHWNPMGVTTKGYVDEKDGYNDKVAEAVSAGRLPEGTTYSDIVENAKYWDVFNELVTYNDESGNAYVQEMENAKGKLINYNVYVIPYCKALEPGEKTLPNIEKVFLDAQIDIAPNGDWFRIADGVATPVNWNSDVDGNPIIYVAAYAIQADANIDTPEEAYAAYQGQWGSNGQADFLDPIINSADDAYDYFAALDQSGKSGTVVLNGDYNTADAQSHWSSNREYALRAAGTDVVLDLNGYTINHNTVYQNGKNTGYTYLFTTAYNAKLTINGEGNIYSENTAGKVSIIYAQGPSEVVINGGSFHAVSGVPVWAGNGANVTINGGSFTSSGSNDEELIYSSGGVIDIYDGFFHNTGWEDRPVNVADRNRDTGFINIYGGTFVNFDPSTGGNDPGNIKVMEGYKVVSETQANGDVWYTVVPE